MTRGLASYCTRTARSLEQDIKEILAVQRDCGERFGEVASRLGLVREQDVRRALARQAIFPLVVPGESELSPLIVAAYQPNSERAEELRTVRSKLVLRWFDRGNKALAVIEANPNNGCNVLAANLAVTFAQLGERTLLIDANLRKPVQQTLFGLQPQFGLVDFIRGRESLENSITQVPDFSCLSVMCAGAPPPNPQEMLGRVSFGYLMETCTHQIRRRNRRYTAVSAVRRCAPRRGARARRRHCDQTT